MEKPYFSGKSPCRDCPYRKDAPLAKWDKSHFDDLKASQSDFWGKTYKCHKNNGSACKGWLIDQWRHNLPSIALRITMSNLKPSPNYLKSLFCKSELYGSIDEMCEANEQIFSLQNKLQNEKHRN